MHKTSSIKKTKANTRITKTFLNTLSNHEKSHQKNQQRLIQKTPYYETTKTILEPPVALRS